MAQTPFDALARHVRGLVPSQHLRDQTDGELLRAFSIRNDQSAFASLVTRHGPLVLAVCRRVLHQLHDAEDAFQATFLVLARNAAALGKQGSLAGWLHGVAHRIALNARRAAARRRRHESQAKTRQPANPAWEAAWREVQLLLDEEIRRLPEKYREPFVLCCLNSQSCAEAARRLGLKEGAVWSRLAEARKRLQRRLSRRGVALTAVLGTAALASDWAAANVSKSLAASTVQAAMSAGMSGAIPTSVIPDRVAILVKAMTRTLLLTRSKLGAALVLALSALAGVAGLWTY
jgi:RNA polymerase sigma factor (sigma-70 family)